MAGTNALEIPAAFKQTKGNAMNGQSARQQFVRDISLVIDNDYETYNLTRDEAKRLNDVYQLAEFLKEFVETQIENAIGNNLIGAQLIREICNGYGTDAYADYARDIMAELAENAGV